jgi:hypothetical protein
LANLAIPADDARPLPLPARITTGRLSFGVFQREAVEPRKRLPLQLRITLVAKADRALLVELRLEQLLEGVATPVPSKTVALKLQRPFGSDFDDF